MPHSLATIFTLIHVKMSLYLYVFLAPISHFNNMYCKCNKSATLHVSVCGVIWIFCYQPKPLYSFTLSEWEILFTALCAATLESIWKTTGFRRKPKSWIAFQIYLICQRLGELDLDLCCDHLNITDIEVNFISIFNWYL